MGVQKFKKKVQKKVRKIIIQKLQIVGGRGGEGRGGEGGELSFQCLRPSTSLMAAGKNTQLCFGLFEFRPLIIFLCPGHCEKSSLGIFHHRHATKNWYRLNP
jgi:hypothetical protein